MTLTAPAGQARLVGRRVVDPADERRFHASMRNDFLTPRGAPYKWQEVTATVRRTIVGGGVPTTVPVRYEWERVAARTGDRHSATDPREWTFARGQGFQSMLLHAEAGEATMPEPTVDAPVTLDVSYPQLPRSPAVDLLLMLSWDVVTFEMMCTHLITTSGLDHVGGRAELERISGSWAELQFSDPGAVAVFRNARATAEHLGHGQFAGRRSAVYTTRCLDCVLDVKSGPMAQRGRSSYWVTLQVEVETGDLLCADMTEMIVATVTGPDGRKVPVQKRRTVRMWLDPDPAPASPGLRSAGSEATRLAEHAQPDTDPLPASPGLTSAGSEATDARREGGAERAAGPARAQRAPTSSAPGPARAQRAQTSSVPASPGLRSVGSEATRLAEHAQPDTDPLPASPGLTSAGSEATEARREGGAERAAGPARAQRAQPNTERAPMDTAVQTAERISEYLTWQIWSLSYLPAGMADLALMGYRSVVGTDMAGTGVQVGKLVAGLRAMAAGEPGAAEAVRRAVPEHRRHLEGLLAFGQIAVDGQHRFLVPDATHHDATRERLHNAGHDLTALLAVLERLERHGPPLRDSTLTERDCEEPS